MGLAPRAAQRRAVVRGVCGAFADRTAQRDLHRLDCAYRYRELPAGVQAAAAAPGGIRRAAGAAGAGGPEDRERRGLSITSGRLAVSRRPGEEDGRAHVWTPG